MVENSDNSIKITTLLPEHACAVAKLHISGIKTGFISSLGLDFVKTIYEAIASSRFGFGLVAEKDGKIVGFVAFSTDLTGLYKSAVLNRGLRFMFLLTGKMLSFRHIGNLFETIFYPARVKKLNVPKAELLSIVVDEEQRGRGLSKLLTQKGLARCREKNIASVKVLVGADNQAANRLYLTCGFQLAGQINNHGVISNVYSAKTCQPATPAKTFFPPPTFQPVGTAKDLTSVLVTYGWCRTTYAVVLSLGRRGIDVHVSDASPTAMSRYSRYCKSFTKVPDLFIEPNNYFDAICKALEKTGAKVLLPAHEDVGIFCRRAKELPKEVLTALPPWDSYRIAEDKAHVLNLASLVGCPTPLTLTVHSYSHLEELSRSLTWPVVLKTHVGNSAKGVRIARSSDELTKKFKGLVETFHLPENRWPILQEFLPGEAAGVCVLYNNGRCIASFAEQYLRCKEPGLFGTSTLRAPLDNPKLISQAVTLMDKLNWNGVAHLDFVADKYGEFKLIEVNPRLWGALALSVFSGVDFPYLWYLTAIKNAPSEPMPLKYPPIKCRWIAGDYLAFMELVKRKMFKEALAVLAPQRKCYHDDFVLTDPLPFSFELLDYAIKFFRSGGSTNPVIEGMVR